MSTLALSNRPAPPMSNAQLGMLLLIGTETILFACFISAYVVLRNAARVWPPMGTPPLLLGLSVWNTAVIAASAVSMFRKYWNTTFALGALFLILQMVEFSSLYARGLTLKSGPYGAVFFTLAGAHGLHVLGGLVLLAMRAKYSALYWSFVTVVWFILFAILYLV
jgi:cytochrome c oxidase subunit 3